MNKTADVEILIVGNEILSGDIVDSNTNWLCKFIHQRGGAVSRVTVVPDVIEVIADAVRAAVSRQVDILFTSGGLGPTSDDLTLQAVAKGSDRDLVLHSEALELVRKQYDHFFEAGIMSQGGLNPAREKMAYLPVGSEPIINPIGTAPAVFLPLQQTTIISVPGVPSELQAIIEQSLQPFLDSVFVGGAAISKRVTVSCNDESLLESVLLPVVKNYPEIYTKSLATTIGEKPEMDIIMSISGIGEKTFILEKAFQELCDGLTRLGFAIKKC
ncbi:competence/damage-inducible protein A [Psychromonas sp. MME2]|uniref:competence/damage-inducible protein A n=1 Tax=unclassified Psychromonas TaxID=2614957 RepID=UPI00339BA435